MRLMKVGNRYVNSVTELAKQCGVSRATIYRKLREGGGTAILNVNGNLEVVSMVKEPEAEPVGGMENENRFFIRY